MLSRMAPLALMQCLPYVGQATHSKALYAAGRPLAARGLVAAILWCLPALALPAWLAGLPLVIGLVLPGALVTAAMVRWLRRRLGGMTGDCLGAAQQVCELAMLLGAAAVLMRMQ